MKNTSLVLIGLAFSILSFAQSWTINELATMPFETSNNAVIEASIGGQDYVYSFGGIGTGKTFSDIHLRSFKYDVTNDVWTEIAPLPDTLGKIAAGASNVKGKIYVIGGYHVFPGGAEASSHKVHIYDPISDAYLTDGAPIPVSIDDHIQAVWKDSLIYIVTGWNNTTNVNNVQVYNPTGDTWAVGTPVPNTTDYKVFGGSGTIVGDTIYYLGGAYIGANFPLGMVLRKGYIDPLNPASIMWSHSAETLGLRYRSASTNFMGKPMWWGGSKVSYNYDGIAYNGSGGVEPATDYVEYVSGNLLANSPALEVMDLRGIAKLYDGKYIIAGGMIGGQTVTNKTFEIAYNYPTDLSNSELKGLDWTIYNRIVRIENSNEESTTINVFDATGKVVMSKNNQLGSNLSLNLQQFSNGLYFMQFQQKNKTITHKIILTD